jgi:hypothetical protein
MEEQGKQRVAMNEAAFRKVNEGIEAGEPNEHGVLSFICECGRLGCNDLIELPREEYAAVRSNERRFIIVPGHEIPAVEVVAERYERYLVVEKAGPAGEVAEDTAPPRPPLES